MIDQTSTMIKTAGAIGITQIDLPALPPNHSWELCATDAGCTVRAKPDPWPSPGDTVHVIGTVCGMDGIRRLGVASKVYEDGMDRRSCFRSITAAHAAFDTVWELLSRMDPETGKLLPEPDCARLAAQAKRERDISQLCEEFATVHHCDPAYVRRALNRILRPFPGGSK